MPVVGVDGCKRGWFAVRVEDDFAQEATADVFPSLRSLLDAWGDATLVLIDIPIGLPDAGRPERGADRAARRLLRPLRHNSVFATPSRATIDHVRSGRGAEYEALSAANHREIGKRLSRQSAAIIPKIAEVDEVLLGDVAARSMVREMHPELCFWALNGRRPMMHRKQDAQGIAERLELLSGLLPWAASIFERTLTRYRRASVQRDDILDAMAAATALPAHPLLSGLQSVPADPERDRQGLPMEMLYRLARRPGASERDRGAGMPNAQTHKLFDTLKRYAAQGRTLTYTECERLTGIDRRDSSHLNSSAPAPTRRPRGRRPFRRARRWVLARRDAPRPGPTEDPLARDDWRGIRLRLVGGRALVAGR